MGAIFVCLIFDLPSLAQTNVFTDSFNRSDLSLSNWLGDTHKFTIDDGFLRTKSLTVNDLFTLAHPLKFDSVMQWSVDVKLDFSTSSVNFVDLILYSEHEDFDTPGFQIFLRIGGTKDKLALYARNRSGEQIEYLSSVSGITHQFSSNVKIIYNAYERWSVQYTSNGHAQILRLSDGLEIPMHTGYAGLRIRQSVSSFHTKHRFDNYYAGILPVDTIPPTLRKVVIIDQHQVNLLFSEQLSKAMDGSSNCTINGDRCPFKVANDWVELFAPQALHTGNHELRFLNVMDTSGNRADVVHAFTYVHLERAEEYDVVISEVMADPDPVVGLPNKEYVELYNRSDKIIDLANWVLTDGSRKAVLPSYHLWPDSFVLLTGSSGFAISNVLVINHMPSLNNNSDRLVLLDENNIKIEEITYSSNWHTEAWKKEGGWSLEKIDLDLICPTAHNWQSAQASAGGSPGSANAKSVRPNDLTPPRLTHWSIVGDSLIELTFDEVLGDEVYLPQQFVLEDFMVSNLDVFDEKTLRLFFDNRLETNVVYNLTVRNVSDCYDNIADELSIRVAIPIRPNPGEVVVNEVLFNPKPFGVDFIEIVNSSPHVLDLRALVFGQYEDGQLANLMHTVNHSQPFFSGDIVCFTEDCSVLSQHYTHFDSASCLEVKQLPLLPDDEGVVHLYRNDGVLLDGFQYHEDWHHPLLNSNEGVSLERTTLEQPTQDQNNWASASKHIGYASPGKPNSQVLDSGITARWQLINDPITPDGDGHNDVFVARLDLEEVDQVVQLSIYDRFGRLMATPVNNTLAGTRNNFLWSCRDESGALVPPDIYIMLLEIIHPDGEVRRYKRGFTIYY